MYLVNYNLICEKCLFERGEAVQILYSDDNLEKNLNEISKDDLINYLDNFNEIICDKCNSIGHWFCVNIYLNGRNNISSQWIIKIIRNEDGNLIINSRHDTSYAILHSMGTGHLFYDRLKLKFNH